ncbi:MAG: pre-peptidase C-terminal domain-containing protein [Phycisphaeraceae bacterium]|nr:MAG: pre-peptidase C-terminal domain-containing protein [Phycisphaeraceae bacterium]
MITRHATVPCLVLAALSGTASAQFTVPAASGTVSATAGNGSGTNSQTSNNVNGFNISAAKSFTNGNASASLGYIRSQWEIAGTFSNWSSAPSPNEAGWSESQSVIDFNLPQSLDMEWNGGAQNDSINGFIDVVVRNRVTNAMMTGGFFPTQVHLPAGQYRITLTTNLPYGSMSGSYSATFRPGNDRCQFATNVGHGTIIGTTTRATADGSATCGNSNNSPSVWYKYTAQATGTLRLDTCGSSYDTTLSVYATNSCPNGTGTQVGCNDDAGANGPCPNTTRSYLEVPVTAGSTYYIRVSGWNGASGDFVLHVGPVNDACYNATPIGLGSHPFDNALADTDGPTLAQCTNNGQDFQVNGDLWYTYTPALSGPLTIDTCTATFDTKLAVYRGAPCSPDFTYLACNDDACSATRSRIADLPVTAGTTYYIRVGGYKTARGSGVLTLSMPLPCPADFNDDGFLDFFDLDAFISCFEGFGCPQGKTADFNADGFVDFFDLDAYVAEFDAGC